jgi:hypothetical protein
MKELCYLLSCGSLKEAPAYRDWDRMAARQLLADQIGALLQVRYY